MPFKRGDEVTVLTLKRKGRVIEEHGRNYRVSVGGVTVVVGSHDLTAVDPPRQKKRQAVTDVASPEEASSSEQSRRRVRRVDLHGLTVEEAREAVLSAVNDAILEGEESLEILHGIGTGRVREAVRRQLKGLPVVRSFRQHPANHGITVVYL
jgi:DNA mismatch repair protein MutS2